MNIVDQLGAVKARIAELQAQEQQLKDTLIASGERMVEGDLFRATVCEQTRETRDPVFKEAVEKLIVSNLSRQFITAHTISSIVPMVRLTARKV